MKSTLSDPLNGVVRTRLEPLETMIKIDVCVCIYIYMYI